jgi:hypothetical protein
MKLGGAPTLKVVDKDDNDITSTVASNYVISYATGATNESNYSGANYGNTYEEGTSMIKIANGSGINP